MNLPPDMLLIDKPKGITSFGVIARLRRELGVKKIGHAGTLDPLASGLMLLGVGEGTKKLKDYVGLEKEYFADILIGERRATGDMEGKILEEKDVDSLDEALIRNELLKMRGTLRLPVSAYSAMKKGGVPMYKRARRAERKGEVVTDVPLRDMEVLEAEFLDMERREKRSVVRVRFKVGSGTYIRSLAEELGKRLGYPATLENLRRTKIGDFDIKDARSV